MLYNNISLTKTLFLFIAVLLVGYLAWTYAVVSFAAEDPSPATKVDLRVDKAKMEEIMNRLDGSPSLRKSADTSAVTYKKVRDHADEYATVSKYQEQYQGVPVWGEYVTLRETAQETTVSGSIVEGLDQGDYRPEDIMSQSEVMKRAKKQSLGSDASSAHYESEDIELFWYVDKESQTRLVYEVSFFASGEGFEPTRPHYIMDAYDGSVLDQWEGLAHALIGTGPGGNLKTGIYEYGTDFDKFDVTKTGSICSMENANVKTVDMLNGIVFLNDPHTYNCPRNTHKTINGGYAPLNDAHFFGNVVHDMFEDWYSTPPLTFQLIMSVHASVGYENAFWNGSRIVLGDGLNKYYPLVSLDVSGHEIAHGFTEQHSGLVYANQSGGIDEAFSDMAGEAAEYYLHGTNDFEIGAEIIKAPGEALRYMADPTLDGFSIDHASNYTAGMNVHFSSGVYNKAFYELTQKPGWNTKKAFDVFFRANQLYWAPNTNYVSGSCDVLDATTDLGYSHNDVVDAFTSVGVSCNQTPVCTVPAAGAWSVTESCVINSSVTIPSHMTITNDSTVTVIGDTDVTMNLAGRRLLITNGSRMIMGPQANILSN